ncbi:MAG: hypothetical protein H0W46_07520, partial [Acidimicrobiia bacterium]|nr:hypothetical protein [Acidimicrobiia bacterium]
MDDDMIRNRLRALGEVPVDPGLASAHLTAMDTARRRRPVAPAAVVLGATVAVAAVATFAVGGGDRPNETLRASAPPSGVTAAPAGAVAAPVEVRPNVPAVSTTLAAEVAAAPSGDPCFGPPPFAGVEPESEAAREAEAEAFSEFRETQCADEGT